MMTTLTISAKNLNPERNYKPFKSIEFNKPVFTKTNLQQGVNKNQTRLANLQKLGKSGIFALPLGAMLIPNVSFAQTTQPTTQQIPNFLNDPSIVIDWSLKIAVASMAVGFGICATLLVTQGILKMFGQRERAQAWKRNIIDGFIEVLVAIPTTSAIYYIAITLFRQLGIFGGLL